tara:strand:+ start:350 stop:484 length:135 start_codon:yes stop_codon:yes gene_type:complete
MNDTKNLIRKLELMIDRYEAPSTGKTYFSVRRERMKKERLNNTK